LLGDTFARVRDSRACDELAPQEDVYGGVWRLGISTILLLLVSLTWNEGVVA
jgi:hypothetical protein